jgi:cell division protein FtsW
MGPVRANRLDRDRYDDVAAAQHRRHRPDYLLLILILILLTIGIVVVYAISPALSLANNVSSNFYSSRQIIAIVLSLITFFVTSRIPLSDWRRWHKPLLIVAALATAVALVMPANPQYPAHRWIRLGSFSFQSVELLKFAVLIWLAGFLSDQIKNRLITDTKSTLKPLLIAVLIIGVIVAGVQSDFGSTVVMMAMIGAMAFIAGMPFRRLLIVGGILAIGGVLLISAVPYRRERLMTFLHPTANCQSTGYQACQALISVGSGGFIGLGLGRSVQAYGYLPEAANDSIFAIYAEKFGFVGVAVILGLFMMLFGRLKNIALRAPDNFSRLFVIGVLAWLSIQSFINIGAMVGLLPLKGITLPFVSYGGTSVVFIMAAMGVVFQISRYASYVNETDGRRSANEDRTDWRRDKRRAYHA